MIAIAEFKRRAMSGPVTKELEFDKALARKVREVVSRYGITYDPPVVNLG